MPDDHWMDCLRDFHFEWRLLQSYAWLIDGGSYRCASQRSRISLNTLRTHIERLEAALGEPLVVRSVRGIEPTAAGDAVLAVAHAMAAARDRTIGDIADPEAVTSPDS